ncbi:MAG TPA: helix-turn-helix domain-containing protein [Aquabacterium sp.]|nr:helix-turn-helix domain-containing protein [Aquabacterium sp.]
MTMLSTAQAAKVLGLNQDTLRRWACGLRKGPLKPSGRFGGALMWDAARVQALAQERAAKEAAG